MDEKEQYKLIGEVVAFCFSVLALLCVVSLAVLALFFPKPYALILKSVGLNNMALNVYEGIYDDSQDIVDGYTFLMQAIVIGDDKFIVKAYESVSSDEEFEDFIGQANSLNIKNVGKSQKLLGLLNEKDYLKGKYISALYRQEGYQKAFDVAKEDFYLSLSNYANSQDDKSYLLNDFIMNMPPDSSLEVFALVDEGMQSNMLTFASKMKVNVDVYLALGQNEQTAEQYQVALESAVRSVEVFKNFEKLQSFDCILILGMDNAFISQKIAESNQMITNVLATI